MRYHLWKILKNNWGMTAKAALFSIRNLTRCYGDIAVCSPSLIILTSSADSIVKNDTIKIEINDETIAAWNRLINCFV